MESHDSFYKEAYHDKAKRLMVEQHFDPNKNLKDVPIDQAIKLSMVKVKTLRKKPVITMEKNNSLPRLECKY